jgi:multidrug transporter EmrE-like cation transporter
LGGVVFIVLAYALLSFNLISNDLSFQILNGLGTIGIIYISFVKKAYQPGVLNIIWLIIAIIAIIKLLV